MAVYDKGYLLIANEKDRIDLAALLYKNGYTPSPVRIKKDGKSYVYLVGYELRNKDLQEGDLNES